MCPQEQLEEFTSTRGLAEGWVLAQRFGEGGDKLIPVDSVQRIQCQHQTLGVDYRPAVRYGPGPLRPPQELGSGRWRGVWPVPTEDVHPNHPKSLGVPSTAHSLPPAQVGHIPAEHR